MKASRKLWIGFKMCRVVVFAISTIMSMALAAIFSVLLLREWKFYNNAQRSVAVIILVVDGFSAILLYLMIIVRFRLWLDGARVMFLVVFQGGVTVTFSILKSSLPCNNLGTIETCKIVSEAGIFVGWSLAGLLTFYALCLAIMSQVPRPPPPSTPEAVLGENSNKASLASTDSLASSKTWTIESRTEDWKGEKRCSLISNPGSDYSWIGPPGMIPPMRSTSIMSQDSSRVNQYGVYRPETPQSVLSTAASSVYSGSTSSYNRGTFNPLPTQPHGNYSNTSGPSPRGRLSFLPNPFMELPSRSGTPVSVASFRSDGFLYTPAHRQMRNLTDHDIPSSLLAGGRPPPPPAYGAHVGGFLAGSPVGHPNSLPPGSDTTFLRFNNNSTPFVFQPGITPRDTHESLKSPGAVTVLSQSASIHLPPSRSPSSVSVPQSPSPPSDFRLHMDLSTPPAAHALPTHPRSYPVSIRGPQRLQEVRRFGSTLAPGRMNTPHHGFRRFPSMDSMSVKLPSSTNR